MTLAPETISESAVRSIAFVSLGCPKNLVDSEKMLGLLHSSGFQLVSDHDKADAIVVNTCGFLEASKDESVDVIREAVERKHRGEVKRVVVAGCLVQRHRAKLLEWAPGIDAMIGVFDRDHIIDAMGGSAVTHDGKRGTALDSDDPALPRYWIAGNALQAARERGLKTTGLTVNGADGRGVGYFEDDSNRFRLTPRHYAYLRVSEGCNQRCAFCTIPSIRGKMRSKPLDAILSEARQLMSDGAFELNLIGQDTTSYGYDIDVPDGHGGRRTHDLVALLQSLDSVGNDFGGAWMRLMYVYPTHFTDEMIDAIASLPNIVKYIDIPLQHMSDRMLSAMRRNITRAQQEQLVNKLRERIPGLAIRTTFITGFPGETQDDHEQLVEFVRDFAFDALGVFRYSREEGTPAGTRDLDPDLHVPEELKLQREAEIMLAQQEIAFENARFVADQRCQFDVLIDRQARGGTSGRATTGVSSAGDLYLGRCYHQAPQIDSVTHVHSTESLSPGELVRCTVIDADGYDFIAQPTHQLERRVSLPVSR
jgi:ribosomal protein S12 methylthiotransferase